MKNNYGFCLEKNIFIKDCARFIFYSRAFYYCLLLELVSFIRRTKTDRALVVDPALCRANFFIIFLF